MDTPQDQPGPGPVLAPRPPANPAARSLGWLAAALALFGGLLVLLGLTEESAAAGGQVSFDPSFAPVETSWWDAFSNRALPTGVAMLGLATLAVIALLVFNAWRYERRSDRD